MSAPAVIVKKSNAIAAQAQPTSEGILAIIAPCLGSANLPVNRPQAYFDTGALQSDGQEGPAVEFGTYFIGEAGKPCVIVRPSTSTASSYGSISSAVTGSSVVSMGSTAGIADDYVASFVCTQAGTIGTGPGPTLQFSLDDGELLGPAVAMGTNTSYSVPVPVTGAASGVIWDFTAGTLNVGDTCSVVVTGPRMTTADLTAALAALRATKLAWDMVLVHGEVTSSFISVEDGWVTAFEPFGVFTTILANTRTKLRPAPATESEATFQTAMSTLLASSSTINVCVGTDGANMVSPVSGVTKVMPTSLYIATVAEGNPIGTDPAFVGLGPLANANLDQPNGQAQWHDEWAYPGLDAPSIRLSTLRSWADREGAYITNAYMLSGGGSPFVYLQHARVMNAACEAVYHELVSLMSAGYARDPKTGLITNAQATDWEARGQSVLDEAIAGQVSGAVFSVSRNDVNTGNGPATITCTVAVEALGYVKTFNVTTKFVNTL